jgi:stage V sporulation protein B
MKLVRFAIPITLFYTAMTLTMDSSLLLVKRMLVDDTLTGFYTAATTIAKITFSIFTALPFILLPSIAAAIAAKNDVLVKKYISQSLRYSMMILLPIAALTSVYAEPITRIFYSDIFAPAASALPLLAWGFTFYSFIMIFSSFMSGANKPQHAMAMAIILFVLAIATNVYLIPREGLYGAALATIITAATGVIGAGIYTWNKFRTVVSILSFARIGGTTALIYAIGLLLPAQGVKAIMYGAILGLVYITILLLLKEIKKGDVKLVFPSYGKDDNQEVA